MTAQKATYGQPESFDWPMLLNRLNGILAARGCKAAGRRCERRNAPLVKPDGKDEKRGDEVHACICYLV